jgi:hypothetical protein
MLKQTTNYFDLAGVAFANAAAQKEKAFGAFDAAARDNNFAITIRNDVDSHGIDPRVFELPSLADREEASLAAVRAQNGFRVAALADKEARKNTWKGRGYTVIGYLQKLGIA